MLSSDKGRQGARESYSSWGRGDEDVPATDRNVVRRSRVLGRATNDCRWGTWVSDAGYEVVKHMLALKDDGSRRTLHRVWMVVVV